MLFKSNRMLIFDFVKIMRNIFALALSLSFFISVSGVNVYKHYCGDFLEGISIYFQTNPCGDEGGEDACSKDKAAACCDDEIEYHQLDVDLVRAQKTWLDFSLTFQLIDFGIAKELVLNTSNSINKAKRAPPNIVKIPIYKKLNRYTFYA